jgi:hypothetical protein
MFHMSKYVVVAAATAGVAAGTDSSQFSTTLQDRGFAEADLLAPTDFEIQIKTWAAPEENLKKPVERSSLNFDTGADMNFGTDADNLVGVYGISFTDSSSSLRDRFLGSDENGLPFRYSQLKDIVRRWTDLCIEIAKKKPALVLKMKSVRKARKDMKKSSFGLLRVAERHIEHTRNDRKERIRAWFQAFKDFALEDDSDLLKLFVRAMKRSSGRLARAEAVLWSDKTGMKSSGVTNKLRSLCEQRKTLVAVDLESDSVEPDEVQRDNE